MLFTFFYLPSHLHERANLMCFEPYNMSVCLLSICFFLHPHGFLFLHPYSNHLCICICYLFIHLYTIYPPTSIYIYLSLCLYANSCASLFPHLQSYPIARHVMQLSNCVVYDMFEGLSSRSVASCLPDPHAGGRCGEGLPLHAEE